MRLVNEVNMLMLIILEIIIHEFTVRSGQDPTSLLKLVLDVINN